MPSDPRVAVRILVTVGDQAEVVADVADAERGAPQRYPAAEIAAAAGLPVDELAGARLTAAVGDDDRLTGWQRA